MPCDARGDAYIPELTQLIKEVGQELIDRSDQIVPPNSKAISGLDIRIEFPQGDRDILPEISWEIRTFSLNTVDRWMKEDKKGISVYGNVRKNI